MLKNNTLLILSLFFSFFFTLIISFPIKFPLQDDWNNIYLLSLDLNSFKLLFVKENNHIQILSRLLLVLNYKIFNLNFLFNQFASLFLIMASLIIFLRFNLKTNHFLTLLFFISIFFSGRLFPTITSSYNIVWLISLLLIVFLSTCLKDLEKLSVKIFFILFLLIATISISITYLIFFVIAFFLSKKKYKVKIFYYILFFFLVYFSINYYSDIYLKNFNELTHVKSNIINIFYKINLFTIFISFFGTLGNLFVPLIKSSSFIAFLIGLTQSLFLIITFKSNYFKFNSENLFKFIIENQLIVIGFAFAFLIAIFRGGDFVEARFTVGSIIFQLGFWLYFYRFYFKKKFYNLVIALFFVLNISVGFFSPYLGVYWQINQYVKSKNVINCYKNANENNCEKIAYFEAFNGGKWFNDKKFKRSVDFLKNNKISIFYE